MFLSLMRSLRGDALFCSGSAALCAYAPASLAAVFDRS
jgi:hypothetical protein